MITTFTCSCAWIAAAAMMALGYEMPPMFALATAANVGTIGLAVAHRLLEEP